MKIISLLKDIKALTGHCGWSVPKEFCTADELDLQQQYISLSTQYYILLGLIPEQTKLIKNQVLN